MKLLKRLALVTVLAGLAGFSGAQAAVSDYVWDGMESEKIYSHDFEGVTDNGWLNPGNMLTHEKVNQVSVNPNPDGEGTVLILKNRRWVRDDEGNYQLGDASFNSHGEHMYPTEAGLETAKEATNVAYTKLPLLMGREQRIRSHQIFSVDVYVGTGAIKFGYLGHRFVAGTTSPETMSNTIIHFGTDGKIYRSGNTSSPAGFEYEHNKWYNLTFVADTELGKLYTYVTPEGGETITVDNGRAISGWTSGSYMLTFSAIVASNAEEWVSYIDNYEHYIMYTPDKENRFELPEGMGTGYFTTNASHIDSVYTQDFENVLVVKDDTDFNNNKETTSASLGNGKAVDTEGWLYVTKSPTGDGNAMYMKNRSINHGRNRSYFQAHGAWMHTGVSTEETKTTTATYFKGVPLVTGTDMKVRKNQIFSVDVYIKSGKLRIGRMTHVADGASTGINNNTVLEFREDGYIYPSGNATTSSFPYKNNTWYTVTIMSYVGDGHYSASVTGDFGTGNIETKTIVGKMNVTAWQQPDSTNLTYYLEMPYVNGTTWESYIDNYSINLVAEDVRESKFLKDNEEISALVPGKIDFEISCDEHVGYTPTVILALIKGDELKLVETDNTTVTDANGNKFYTASLNVPEDIDSTYTLEAFVWDSIGGMKPIQSVQALEIAEATD